MCYVTNCLLGVIMLLDTLLQHLWDAMLPFHLLDVLDAL